MSPNKLSTRADDTAPAPSLVHVADALLRAAADAARQHERVGRLLQEGGLDDELAHVATMCDAAVKYLAVRTASYETAAAAGKGSVDDAVWRAANGLWHASRDCARRHTITDALANKSGKHSPERLSQLQVEFELEASAVLALRQSIAAYRKLRPGAE